MLTKDTNTNLQQTLAAGISGARRSHASMTRDSPPHASLALLRRPSLATGQDASSGLLTPPAAIDLRGEGERRLPHHLQLHETMGCQPFQHGSRKELGSLYDFVLPRTCIDRFSASSYDEIT